MRSYLDFFLNVQLLIPFLKVLLHTRLQVSLRIIRYVKYDRQVCWFISSKSVYVILSVRVCVSYRLVYRKLFAGNTSLRNMEACI